MFREVLRKVCTQDLKHEVVGEAGDGRRAVELAAEMKPDLILLDLHLPLLDGFSALSEIRKAAPFQKILVLSSHCDEYTVYRAERAHIQGFVDKNTNTVEALKKAITTVDDGRLWFSETFQKMKAARHRDPQSFDKLLTDREREILALLGAPLTEAAIAKRLSISADTVEKHRFNIQRKLELASLADVVRYAREHGFTLSTSIGGDGSLLP